MDKIEYRNAAGTLTGSDDFTYNSLLQRTAATSRYGVNSGWTYDDQGRMLTESTTYSSQTYNVGYHYDSRGRLDEITYPSGRKVAYTFDERSSIDLIKWDNNTIEDRGYDDLARLNAVTRTGSAVDETRTYDNAGRLTSIGNTNVGTYQYTYDANHNKLTESWIGNMQNGTMNQWNFTTVSGGSYPQGYDHEDRFVHFAQTGQSKTFNFTRSDIGNINNINLNGTGTARGFSNIHALTSIGAASQTFDNDGNLTTNQYGHTNTWDEAGYMKQSVVPTGSAAGVAGTNEYGYDATQRRIFKKITRNGNVAEHSVFVHAGPNLIAEYASGTAATTPTNEYVYAQEIDSLVLLARSNNASRFTITRNQQWSVTALSDASNGSVVERYTYDHFGKRTILEPNGTTVRTTSSYAMPFGYTSRQHDAETGLMYFRARYYDPASGEFTSPDPMEYVDGMSLFRGYFVINDSDSFGLSCTTLTSGWTLPLLGDGDQPGSSDTSLPAGKIGKLMEKFGIKIQISAVGGSCEQTTCSSKCCDVDHVKRLCNTSGSISLGYTGKNPGIYFGVSGSIAFNAGLYFESGGCPYRERRDLCMSMTGTLEFKVCGGQDDFLNGCVVLRVICDTRFCANGSDGFEGGCKATLSLTGCIAGIWCSEWQLGETGSWPSFGG